MKTFILFLLVTVSLSGAAQVSVTKEDFMPLAGTWKGTLTYLDYTNNTSETIKTNAAITIKEGDIFELSLYYTDEPDHNNAEVYSIKENGTMLNNMKVIERIRQTDGSLKIIFENKGTDGNDYKAAIFNHVYIISKNSFIITKLVKFDGQTKFFQRNQYAFSR